MLRFLLFLSLFVFSGTLRAQSFWTDTPKKAAPKAGERRIVPQRYRLVQFDLDALQTMLTTAPERFGNVPAENEPILVLPMPDGGTARFRLAESPVMAPELQARYPESRCYTGTGIDDPTATLKCDLTPWGFHAMIRSGQNNTVFIDPYIHGKRDYYSVYFKKDYGPKNEDESYTCETVGKSWHELNSDVQTPDLQGDCRLRRYRLALACTGEYAAFHGGTKPLVLAAMNTTMNRVNGVYESDFAVTMQIVPNDDTLIFLVAASDPYTNNNGSTMLGQNITTCNSRIGLANYDIGHVFSTGGGGVAQLGVVCSNNKAGGVTGGSSPIGDPFDIDYVAHEMGHQFDADHTQNNNCNRVAGASMEPGSASSIMGYAGICSPNVQANSDDYFHAISLQQINVFVNSGTGNNCPVKIVTGNTNPTVGGGADYTIPKSTPFALTATGSDVNNDALTYCWEQMDPEFTAMPPVATSATGPLFRTYKGTVSPTRYFPRLQDLVSNTVPTWETLPGVARVLKFRVTARDNHNGAGCSDEDDVVLTVAGNAGPFVVTEPNTLVSWPAGATKTVTWDVANTNIAPVNCANVRISLSTDGGYTYPITLANSVPNNGSANVVVPSVFSTTCRVKVAGIGNVFFDISNQDFKIEDPTFTLVPSVGELHVCAGDSVSFDLIITGFAGFNSPVQFDLSGLPAGAVSQILPGTLTPDDIATVHLSGFTSAMAGTYTLTVTGTGGSITQIATVSLMVLASAPTGSVSLISPADGVSGLPAVPTLVWSSVPFAQSYNVAVATDPAFSPASIVFQQAVSGTSVQASGLQGGTVYYWHVQPLNSCGDGVTSATFAFQTASIACDQVFTSTDVPQTIDSTTVNTALSILNVPANAVILDVNVTLTVSHTYVGDLDAQLTTPSGQNILLFDRPGEPATVYGCPNDNIDLVFDDTAVLTAGALENECSNNGIALLGTYQPIDPLTVANGNNAMGAWKMAVTDNSEDDGGTLTGWSLRFCFAGDTIPDGNLAVNNPLMVSIGGSGLINDAFLKMTLSGTPDQGKFTLLSLPQHGALTLAGVPLGVGDMFTQTNIDAGQLLYTHNGDNATTDDFHFDALDQNNLAWVHNAVFNILIVQNNLAAVATQTAGILCHDGADGEITINATGLDGQYQYSLNGGPVQSSNVFSGLAPGSYTVVVTGQFGYMTTSNTVVISNPDLLSATASVVQDSIIVTASGGTGVYEYSLDGLNFQTENLFDSLANGVYTIKIQDQNGCTATTQAIVSVNSLLVDATVQSDVLCAGSNEGSILVNVGGGQAPYMYSLNGGVFQFDNLFTGLTAGVYVVTVKDDQGFEVISDSIALNDPAAIVVSAAANLNSVTVTASGGTGNLEYSLDGQNFQTGNMFTNLANGVYTVSIQDANGCIVTTEVTVDVPPLDLSAAITQNILCSGNATGEITITGQGGIPPYEYALDTGAYQNNNVFSGLAAGTYTISVRDITGTVTSYILVLLEPDPLNVDVTVVDNDASVNVTGGTAPYSLLLNGAPFSSLENLVPGTYALLVNDANGCTAGSVFEIFGNTITLTASSESGVSCHGSTDGTALFCISGGYPPLTVTSTGFFTSVAGPCDLNIQFENVAPGTYDVIVTDAQGFTQTYSFTILDAPEITATAITSNDMITVSASGGTGTLTYSLDGINYQDSPVFTGLPNGTYTVFVTDEKGCVVTVENLVIFVSAIVEPASAWGLGISPNPGSGLFNLTMLQAPASLRADVYDAAGRLLHNWQLEPGNGTFTTQLDLQDLPQGVYFLRLTDGVQSGGLRLCVVR